MPSPKKGSPGTKSPAQSKASPAGKKSPKKGDASKKAVPEVEVEEDEVVVPVCEGIMHRRMRYILETTLKSDVDFLLGPDDSITTIKAHKCMLQAESPIFEKLFNECDEFKARVIRQHEEEMRLDRERDREMEVAVKLQESQKSVTAASTAGKKKSPEKKEKRPSGRKTPEKKSPEKSPKKSPGQKKSSPPKKKEDRGASGQKVGTEGEVENKINFHQDVVEGLDLIRIRDVHPLGFYRLLRYIYYDEMVFTGVVGTLRTLYAARKYLFYDLARACINYLENNVCIEHVLKLLKASLEFHEERLKNLCMRLIINDTFEVIRRQEFSKVPRDIIHLILQQDILNIREIELYDQVMTWAENECDKIGIPVTAMNQRIALSNINFNLIRFPTMLQHEFATHIVESGVLQPNEIIPILQYYITGRKINLPYSCVTRRRPCLDLAAMETASVCFSDQTDVTFLGYTGLPRRAHSFRDIYVPSGVLPPIKKGMIKQRNRTGSPPGRFNVPDDEFSEIEENIRHLIHLHREREHLEYSRKHQAVMSSHFT